jgi:hypothetical protein
MPCRLFTWPAFPTIEKASLVLASPAHTRPSEAIPQNAWSGRWKVSFANMFTLFDIGEGIVGTGVAMGSTGVLAGLLVCNLFTCGSVNAASIEREKTPAIKPPSKQMPSVVKMIQRIFICLPHVQ